MTQENFNWKQTIIIIILTGAVTFASSVALELYKSEEPKLMYSNTSSDPFKVNDSYLIIHHIVIENKGKDKIPDVKAVCKPKDATIIARNLEVPSSFCYSDNINISNSSYTLNSDYMNPNDVIEIFLLISSKDPFSDLRFSIRGEGTNGKRQTRTSQNSTPYDIFAPYILGISFMLLILGIGNKIGNIFNSKETNVKLSADQHENLLYLCGVNGLNEDLEYYLTYKTTYLIASDYFTFKALNNNNLEYKEKVIKLFNDLINYANVSDFSKAIIYYNLARIEMSRGNSSASVNNLNKAKEYNTKVVNKRLTVDTIFDKDFLDSFRQK